RTVGGGTGGCAPPSPRRSDHGRPGDLQRPNDRSALASADGRPEKDGEVKRGKKRENGTPRQEHGGERDRTRNIVSGETTRAAEGGPMGLGRHGAHDPRSRGFPAARARVVKSVRWKRHEKPFDQGQIGSCTGNAIAGACSTDPFGKKLRESDAVKAYALATTL